MENLKNAIWTPSLARRLALAHEAHAATTLRARVATILCDSQVFHLFVYRWNVFVAYCVQCERHPQIMARDPECIDAALIELSTTAAYISKDVHPKLHRILAELDGIATRTRPFRQQCARARDQDSADA